MDKEQLMKTLKAIGILALIWLGLNLLALIINLLFSNLITGGLLLLTFFVTPLLIAYKYLTKE